MVTYNNSIQHALIQRYAFSRHFWLTRKSPMRGAQMNGELTQIDKHLIYIVNVSLQLSNHLFLFLFLFWLLFSLPFSSIIIAYIYLSLFSCPFILFHLFYLLHFFFSHFFCLQNINIKYLMLDDVFKGKCMRFWARCLRGYRIRTWTFLV